MADHDDTTYEAPVVDDIDVAEGPASVAPGLSQIG
ncbi:MAG: hypothetical protein QOH62_744 [Solirubrobacteraceae bacterium]|jgi:hypothetical protein|nr:hypothetical protein [Solirubrobacteraceae bacterium]